MSTSIIHAAREKFLRRGQRPVNGNGPKLYEAAFFLKKRPFDATADPSFLYESAGHREALAGLILGVGQNRGLMTLTGPGGTGKTMLLQALLREPFTARRSVILCHTTLDRDEIITMILHKLKLEDATLYQPGLHLVEDRDFFHAEETRAPSNRVGRICRLTDYVEGEARAARRAPLLIIDEAQHLSDEVLEEIRLLNNLEMHNEKLLQVILSGQTALEERLRSPELRQFRQRIHLGARLTPLSHPETVGFIAHRLRVGGCGPTNPFTAEAMTSIWKASGGIPRIINAVCEQSLINAYGLRKERIDREVVEESLRDLTLEQARSKPPAETVATGVSSDVTQPAMAPATSGNGSARASTSEQTKLYGVRLASFHHAEEAKAYATALVAQGHQVRAVRSMRPDGDYVTHVLGGLYATRDLAGQCARHFQSKRLTEAEVLEFSGWTSTGTLHSFESNKDRYLDRGANDDGRESKEEEVTVALPAWASELAEN